MKALLGILVFVSLSYCDDPLVITTEGTPLETPSEEIPSKEILSTPFPGKKPGSGANTTEQTKVFHLSCHSCSGSYLCEGPAKCKKEDKFCVITINEVEHRKSIAKYCAKICPIRRKFEGKVFQNYYTGCCVTNLCNFKKLGKGHQLGASIPLLTMVFVACFTRAFQIGL